MFFKNVLYVNNFLQIYNRKNYLKFNSLYKMTEKLSKQVFHIYATTHMNIYKIKYFLYILHVFRLNLFITFIKTEIRCIN